MTRPTILSSPVLRPLKLNEYAVASDRDLSTLRKLFGVAVVTPTELLKRIA